MKQILKESNKPNHIKRDNLRSRIIFASYPNVVSVVKGGQQK